MRTRRYLPASASSVSRAWGSVSTGFCSICLPKLRISAMTEAGTWPLVTSTAVSIIDRVKPFTPKP